MYHYVHERGGGGFSRRVGRSYEEFQGQLDYIQHHYTVIDAERFVDAVRGNRALPANACMLTFDDGYRIHHSIVFQALKARGLCGFFFPPARSAVEPVVLDVHKIHFALTAGVAHAEIGKHLCGWIDGAARALGLQSSQDYWALYARPSRFDPAETVFIKRVLQKGLPEEARSVAVDWLFRRFAGRDEAALSAAFYMNPDELREMVRAGMSVGSHGYAHRWLDTLDEAGQTREIEQSLDLLSGIGADTRDWIMCYPYGGQSPDLVALLPRFNCLAGVTTRVAVADVGVDTPLLLPRLDTNDLPLADGPPAAGRPPASSAAS
jgi:peptidoglycan/xylan/chitin deacetylase (PgdA/CDA1 family)